MAQTPATLEIPERARRPIPDPATSDVVLTEASIIASLSGNIVVDAVNETGQGETNELEQEQEEYAGKCPIS